MTNDSQQARFSRRDKPDFYRGKENTLNQKIMNYDRNRRVQNESLYFSRSLSSVNHTMPLACKNNFDMCKNKRRSRSEGFDQRSSRTSKDYESVNKDSWISRNSKILNEEGPKNELKPIWRLRTFNNWAKSYLLLQGVSKFPGNSLIGLDLGCCQGGDLKKWFHCRIEHLYLVENNTSAMSECKRRYSCLKKSWINFYDAFFIEEDFTVHTLRIPEVADVISSQMAIHRAFESREKAERMAWNISQTLKCGGSLVISLTNAAKIIESLRKTPGWKCFGNSVYQVKVPKPLPKNKDIPDFGFRFEFSVGPNTFEEYLVQLPVLKKVMAKYGLILEEKKSFLEMYFSARRFPEQVRCMQKMGVVRWGHSKKDKKRVYLTMSDDEREAASLYDALIFKKVFK
ncbi:UNVERIFIED_CONTAM: hypothetical protein RMT77_012964 [Armadillidium vulgare]